MPMPKYPESYGTEFHTITRLLRSDGEFRIPAIPRAEAYALQRRFYGWRAALKRSEKSLGSADLEFLETAMKTVVRLTASDSTPFASYSVDFQVGREVSEAVAQAIEAHRAKFGHASREAQDQRPPPASRPQSFTVPREAGAFRTSDGIKTPTDMYLTMPPSTFALCEFSTPTGEFLGTGWAGYLALCATLDQPADPRMITAFSSPVEG